MQRGDYAGATADFHVAIDQTQDRALKADLGLALARAYEAMGRTHEAGMWRAQAEAADPLAQQHRWRWDPSVA